MPMRTCDDRPDRPLAAAAACGWSAARVLLLALATSALGGCALVTWAFGESRSSGEVQAPVTPASPLGGVAAPTAPTGTSRAEPGTTLPGPAGAVPAAEPATGNRPAAGLPSSAPTPAAATAVPSAAPAPLSPAPIAPAPISSRPRPPAPAAAPTSTAPPVAAGRYVVQLGAFRSAGAAQSVRDQLAAELERAPELAGLLGTLRVASEGGLHRVWLGAAGTAAEAGALAARIRAATGRDTFVTRP